MPKIYDALVDAIAQHWKAHDNKYPQKIVLTQAQLDDLVEQRRTGRIALNIDTEVERETFLGVRLEVDSAGPTMLIAIDGAQVPIAQ